ncbi:MAG: adenylate/guanylate cyclase domain-containing protein [Planctomycetota bacterium]|nr:adenylate/guanylate cyclase domain-containing protein [Planctomycetota bacterium]
MVTSTPTPTPTPFSLRVTDLKSKLDSLFDLSLCEQFNIGRGPGNSIPVVWDREVSREHAILRLIDNQIHVACLPSATNPILMNGTPVREVVLDRGCRFVIGKTSFSFELPGDAEPDNADFDEISLNDEELKGAAFGDPGRQMDLLCTLPELIGSASSDIDLARLLAEVLLDAIPQSVAVSAAQYDAETVNALRDGVSPDELNLTRPQTMRVCTREDYEGRFLPSRRLVASAIEQGQPTIHVWGQREDSGGFTMSDSLDWAFCVPVPGAAQERWCFYVAGKGSRNGGLLLEKADLMGDVRFAKVLAQFIGSVRHVRQLQDQRTQLSSFFSPKVIENLTGSGSADVLAPAEREISVLFCDVRGFSRKSEKHADDLHYLLSCVKEALGAMTQGILAEDGTIADFQGDAALGFWGWPVSLSDGAVPACRAALKIQAEFRRECRENDLLDGFSVGIGIAHGDAIAGQIGTSQQAKIGVFGPVVNQGSRLEGMTKQFGVSICLDEASAEFARQWLPPEQARVRRLARVRPKGMDTAVEVSDLLLPCGPDCETTDCQIADYEKALAQVIAGDWAAAISLLDELPADGPQQFLLSHMAKLDNTPPADWDGTFSLNQK